MNSTNFYSTNNQDSNDSLIIKLKGTKDLLKKFNFYRYSISKEKKQKLKNIEEWIAFFEEEKNVYKTDKNRIYLDFILVDLYRESNNIEKAIKIGLESYYNNINSFKDDDFLCGLLINIENCYVAKGNSLGLIKINKEKLKKCNPEKVNFYNIFSKMGMYDMAIDSYKRSSRFNSIEFKNGKPFDKAQIYNNIGVYFMYDQKIDSALYYYKNSLSILNNKITNKHDGVLFWIGLVEGNIGSCYVKQSKYKKAIPYLLEEKKRSEVFYKSNVWQGAENNWKDLALCYLKTNQFTKAKKIIYKLKNNKNIYYNLKSQYFNQNKEIDSAAFYFNKFTIVSDSIYKSKSLTDKKELLNFLEFEDEIILQQKQIFELEKEDTLKSQKIKIISIASIILLAIFLMLLYNYLGKIKSKKIVETQKEKLELSLNKNKTLLKELNHRVKNNLQMVSSVLSLQAKKIKSKEAKLYFDTSVNRIKVLSKIHNSLYNNRKIEQVDLLEYITTLKDYLVSSIINPEIKVDFNIDIPKNTYLNIDKKVTLGLIINELITNSFKYAFNKKTKNKISISINKKEDVFYFNYSDNGIGFNENEIDKTKSIGLNLILRLVNQLGEEADLNSENGLKVSFKFLNN